MESNESYLPPGTPPGQAPGGPGVPGGPGAPGGPHGMGRSGPPWILPVLVGIAVVVLLAGLIVLVTRGDDEVVEQPASTSMTSMTPTSAAPTTDAAPTTAAPTTVVETTAAPTTVVDTTEPAPTTTVQVGPDGSDSWVVTSPHYPDEPFEMRLAVTSGPVTAYDGRIRQGDDAIRCVAVTIADQAGWNEACTMGAAPTLQYVVVAGADPWLVTVGQNLGEVTLTQQPPNWTLPTNGCADPLVPMLATAARAPAMPHSIGCVEENAVATFAPVLLQNGAADGATALLSLGDGGWSLDDVGTDVACDPDARLCGDLPLPPVSMLPASLDIVMLRDETETVRDWVGDETDADAITEIVLDEVSDPGAEVDPTVDREGDIGYGSVQLVVIEVPQMDDSTASITWAIWLNPPDGGGPTVARATAWNTCARGVSDGLCV